MALSIGQIMEASWRNVLQDMDCNFEVRFPVIQMFNQNAMFVTMLDPVTGISCNIAWSYADELQRSTTHRIQLVADLLRNGVDAIRATTTQQSLPYEDELPDLQEEMDEASNDKLYKERGADSGLRGIDIQHSVERGTFGNF